jgi:hypothetical protein
MFVQISNRSSVFGQLCVLHVLFCFCREKRRYRWSICGSDTLLAGKEQLHEQMQVYQEEQLRSTAQREVEKACEVRSRALGASLRALPVEDTL